MAKPKRRSRNHKRRADKAANESVNDEIEAQLQRQRRKRALESETDSIHHLPTDQGQFEYDQEKKAYFPKGYTKTNKIPNGDSQQQNPRMNPFCTFVTLQSYPVHQIHTAWLGHATEICTSSSRFLDLRIRWAGRIILNAMCVEPSTRQRFDSQQQPAGWSSLLPQLKRSPNQDDRVGGQDLPWDFGCKMSLHSASRTFDVQQNPDDSRLPCIATLVDGGFLVRSTAPRAWTERQYLGPAWERNIMHYEADKGNFMLRFASHMCLVRLNNQRQRTMDMLQLTPGQTLSTRVDISCCDCNDVAFHPEMLSGCASIAVAPRIGRDTQLVTLYRDISTSKSFNVRTAEFSKSDALCVEYLNSDVILFGHRNGAVSLFDTRTARVQRVSSANVEEGSTTSILPLANSQTFIAKRSFGSCYLFDVRKLSGHKDSAQLLHFAIPAANGTISSCCSGVAVDPTETTVISPFADNQRKSHFALWSLKNGSLIGSKPIQTSDAARVSCGLPHTELRSTVTPAWKLETKSNGKFLTKKVGKHWSLWFKSYAAEPQVPTLFGSIHQLTFPGESTFPMEDN